MGRVAKVLPTQEVVENTIKTYMSDATSSYPNFLETAPVFVTYYSRNHLGSTYDVNFVNYNEIAGEESPNKFHKIENLPVYSLDTSDFGKEMGDDGWSGEVRSSCIILPNTIKPMPDDLIEIEIHSKNYLFQVTNGSSDNYGNTKFYKIDFQISQYRKDEAERQTQKEFKVDFDSIGKHTNVVVEKNLHEYLDIARFKYDELLNVYSKEYYDRTAQCFGDKDLRILDQYLNEFIHRHELNKPYLQYRNSAIISPTLRKHVVQSQYLSSVYHKLPTKTISKDDKIIPYREYDLGKGQYQLIYMLKDKYNLVTYVSKLTNKEEDTGSSHGASFLSFSNDSDLVGEFISTYLDYLALSDEEKHMEKVEELLAMIEHLPLPYVSSMTTIMNSIESNAKEFNLQYYTTPIVLYIIKQMVCLILSK